jgi:hypothetical protein
MYTTYIGVISKKNLVLELASPLSCTGVLNSMGNRPSGNSSKTHANARVTSGCPTTNVEVGYIHTTVPEMWGSHMHLNETHMVIVVLSPHVVLLFFAACSSCTSLPALHTVMDS